MLELDEAKLHLRVDHDEEDALIQSFIDAAAERVVNFIGQKMPDPIPASIKLAALMFVADAYENREVNLSASLSRASEMQNRRAEDYLMPFRVSMGV